MNQPRRDEPRKLRPADLGGLIMLAGGIGLLIVAASLVDVRLGLATSALALIVIGALLGYERSR